MNKIVNKKNVDSDRSIIRKGKKRVITLEHVQDLAKSRLGECLSTEYTNLITPLEWKCSKNHIFMKKPQYIFSKKCFCTACRSDETIIRNMNNMVSKYNGICLSTGNIDISGQLKWKCENGHVFMRKPEYIRKHKFCLECKK